MKSYLLSFFALAILLTTSCKDDDCVAGSLENEIIGEWNVTIFIPVGTVEFKANGDLIDMGNALLDEEVNGVALDKKSYVVVSNSLIRFRAENDTDFAVHDVEVTSFDCDEIVLDLLGVEGKLRRK